MQNIPGLRSCYDKVGRLIYFGRMLDKIRLHAAAQLPPPSNLWHFTRDLGADAVAFSGGKALRGPQASEHVGQ